MHSDGNRKELPMGAVHATPSEAEIFQLLDTAAKQYEEYIRLAESYGYAGSATVTARPTYSWNNPIGLVITENSCAKLA